MWNVYTHSGNYEDYDKIIYVYVRSKQRVLDKVGPIEDHPLTATRTH